MTESITYNGRQFPVISSTPAKAGPRPKRAPAHRLIPRPLDGPSVESGTLTLSMAPPSVNSLFFNKGRGRGGRGKTLAYRNWRAFADRELRDQPSWHVAGKVTITIRVGGSKADVDNLCKAPLDALVGAGRISDDKELLEVHAIHDDTVRGTVIEIARAL